jgi:hydroxymethylpyrimidine/phosphomethylpyrimidine kinase
VNAKPPIVLAFAASDPTGGAGIQADLLTLASLGCHPLTVLTALTAQDTIGVHRVHAVQPDLVEEQARRALADIPVAAFKLGVLGSRENAAVVARILALHPSVPVVIDPVLASGRGDPLGDASTYELLLPRCTVLTPNSKEARALAGVEPLDACAARLTGLGAKHVLITGTHEPGAQVTNTLYDAKGKVRADSWPRLPGEYHGSGCTLASAIAAFLARGLGVVEAAREAQAYTWKTLEAGFKAGAGQLIPDRFFDARSVRDHA